MIMISTRLIYQDNWESDVYWVAGKRINSLRSVDIGDKSYTVTARQVSVPYSDHGHRYESTSTHYFINVPVGGNFSVPVDLNRVVPHVAVFATDWD